MLVLLIPQKQLCPVRIFPGDHVRAECTMNQDTGNRSFGSRGVWDGASLPFMVQLCLPNTHLDCDFKWLESRSSAQGSCSSSLPEWYLWSGWAQYPAGNVATMSWCTWSKIMLWPEVRIKITTTSLPRDDLQFNYQCF